MPKVTVDVPATTANLGPGFDCLGLALAVRNRVEVEPLERPRFEVTIAGDGAGELPTGRRNLVAVAMRHVFDLAPVAPAGARIHQTNGIPLCSGMGSSAAARVGGLVAANELCGRPFDTGALAALASGLEGHPDNVVPALVGGLAVSTEDGEGVRYVRLDPPAGLRAVMAIPAQQLLTSSSRRVLPRRFTREDTVYNIGRTALLVAGFVAGDDEAVGAAMQDRVHQPYRLPLIPGAEAVLAAAREAGAIGAVISGAGPSLLALCRDRCEAVAEAMRVTWAAHDVEARSLILDLDAEGARIHS